MTKLPPLPPLPRKRTVAQERREKLSENLTGSIPQLGRWGGIEVGRWAETKDGDATQVVGRCHKCGEITAAQDLNWEDGPFGKPGGWTCFQCRRRSNVTRK